MTPSVVVSMKTSSYVLTYLHRFLEIQHRSKEYELLQVQLKLNYRVHSHSDQASQT